MKNYNDLLFSFGRNNAVLIKDLYVPRYVGFDQIRSLRRDLSS